MEAKEILEREMWIFSNITRQKIIYTLSIGDLCGRDLGNLLDIRQPNVSKHTEKMVETGIIYEYKIGRRVFYRLNSDIKEKYSGVFRELKRVYAKEIPRKNVRACINTYTHSESDVHIDYKEGSDV